MKSSTPAKGPEQVQVIPQIAGPEAKAFQTCSKCGFELQQEYAICPKCGTPKQKGAPNVAEPASIPCKKCNKPLEPRFKVCPYCGAER
ncbi:MAG: zinc-ribbon domain-containing protein [Planctomycetota bacterium]